MKVEYELQPTEYGMCEECSRKAKISLIQTEEDSKTCLHRLIKKLCTRHAIIYVFNMMQKEEA